MAAAGSRRRQKQWMVLASAAAASATFASISAVRADTKTYTNGTGDSSWDNGGNWSAPGKPGAADDVLFPLTIPGSRIVNLTTGEVANSLSFNNSYNLQGGDVTAVSGNIYVDPGPVGASSDGAGFASTISSNLLGSAGLNKLGAGTLELASNNTFTGTVSVTGGTLGIVNDTNLGSIATIGGPVTGVNTISLDGGVLQLDAISANAGAGFLQVNRTINLGASGGTIEVRILGGAGLENANALAGTGTLTKTGLGQFFLLNSNDYAGAITLATNGGSFDVRSSGALTSASSITINPGSNLNVDNQSGIANSLGVLASTSNQDRIANTIPINLNGGTINYQARNTAGQIREVFGATATPVTLNQGQSTINALGYTGSGTANLGGEIELGNLARTALGAVPTISGGGTVNFTGTGTLGATGSNGRIFIDSVNGGAAPANNTIIGGWATVGAEFAGYTTATGVVPANATFAGTTATLPASNTPTANVRLAATAAVPAGGLTINSINIAGGFDLTFTNPGDTLTLNSGGLLSSNNNKNIGSAATPGQITSSGSELFFHINGSTTTLYSLIKDNGAPVALVKDQGGQLTFGNASTPADNTYSGGTYVQGAGTLTTGANANQAYLGTGPVFINNGTLNQGARGATASTAGYTVVNNGEIVLTASNSTVGGVADYTADGDRYNLASGTSIYANSPGAGTGFSSLTRVNTPADLTSGGTIYLAPDSIIQYNMTNAAGQGTGPLAINNLGANADLYFAPGNNPGSAVGVVIGSGTAYKGLSTDRSGRTFTQGTITANSSFYLQGLAVNGGYQTLTLGGGPITIVNNAGRPISAIDIGNVTLNTALPNYPSSLTFVQTAGQLLLSTANSLGTSTTDPTQNASVVVQAGGYLNLGGIASGNTVNGNVYMESGSRFLADDNLTGGTLNGIGTITFARGAILDITQQNGITGSEPIVLQSGAIVRLQTGGTTTGSTTSISTRLTGGAGATYESFNGNRTLTSQVAPESPTLSGAILTNDSNNRNFDPGFGRLMIGSGGLTVAATTHTYVGLNEDYDLGTNTLTIGSNESIASNPKAPAVPTFITGIQTTQVQLTSQGSKGAIGSNINVIANYQLRQNTGNSLPDLTQINLAAGASLQLTQNFQELAGGLSGAGNVVSTDDNAKLGVGYNNANTTFSGGFLNNFDPNSVKNPSIVKVGTGRLTLDGTSNSTNSLTVNQGEIRLSGPSGTTAFVNNYVNKAGTLTLDNSTAAVNDRLGGTGVSRQVYMGGGTFNLVGNGSTAVTENVTQFRDDAGGSGLVTFTPGAGFTLATPTLQGRSISTFVLHGDKLGATPGAGVASFVITPTTADQNGANLVGSITANAPIGSTRVASTPGTSTVALRPDILSDTPATGGTAPLGFTTVDNSANGLRRLDDSTEYTTAIAPGTSTSTNVQQSAPITFPGAPAPNVSPVDTQIQSLVLNAGATSITNGQGPTLTNAQTRLRVSSGGVLVQPGFDTTITTPYFDSGTTFYFHTYSNMAINGTLLGSGFTKSGTGNLTLGDGAVPYVSGNIAINDGAVKLGANNNTWFTNTGTNINASSLYLAGGSLDINGNSQVFNLLKSVNNPNTQTQGFLQELPGMSGNLLNTGAAADITVLGNNGTFNGSISGPINLTKAGGGNLDLTNADPYQGTTTLRGGSMQLRSKAMLANTTNIVLNSGALYLDNQNGIVDPTTGLYNIDNRIPSNIPITLRDGVLELRGGPGEMSKQTIQSITMERSGNFINNFAANSGGSELRIGNLFRDTTKGPAIAVSFGGNNLGRLAPDPAVAGGVSMNQDSRTFITNLNGSPNTLDADPTLPATTTNGFIGGWAIINSDTFALYKQSSGVGSPNLNNGSPIVGGVATNNIYPSMANGNSSAATSAAFVTTNLVDVNTDSTLTAGDKMVGGIRLSGGALRQLLFTGANDTVNVESGDIIRSNNNNGFNIGSTTARGRLTAGGATATGQTQNLYLFANQNSGNNNIVNSVIVNNPNGDPVRFVKGLSASVDLTAFNTYTGGTFVNGGTIRLAPTTAANGTTNVVLPGDVTIQDNANVTETGVDQLSRTANISIIGGGILNLSTTANDVNYLASVNFNNYGASRNPQVTVATATTLNLAGNITSVNDTLAATPLIAAGNTTTSVLDLQGATRTFDVSGQSPIGLVVNTSIANGGIIKNGSSMLALGGAASTFGGGVQINAGQVRVDNGSALSTSANSVTVGSGATGTGAALVINTGTTIPAGVSTTLNAGVLAPFNNNITLAGSLNVQADSTIAVNDYYQSTTARNVTINGATSGAGTLTVQASPVSGQTGTLTFTNPGNTFSGALVMGANSNVTANSTAGSGNVLTTGDITLNGGTLNIRDNGSGSNVNVFYGNNITVNGNATISIDHSSANSTNMVQFFALNLNNATLTLNSGSTYSYDFGSGNPTTISGAATINNSAAVSIGTLNDGTPKGTLTKNGTGTLNVTAPTGTFTGGTTVGQGTLRIAPTGGGASLGNGPLAIKLGATLQSDPGGSSTVTYTPSSILNEGLIYAKTGTTDFGSKFISASPSLGLQPLSALSERFAKPADVGEPNFDSAATGDPHISLENANTFLTPNPGPGKVGPGIAANGATPLSFDQNALSTRSGGYFGTTEQGVVYRGTITIGGIIPAGPVSFGTNSDDGSALYVDLNGDHQFTTNERIVTNFGPHAPTQVIGTANLAAGTYDVAVAQYNGGGGGLIEARFAAGSNVAYPSQYVFNPGGSLNAAGNIQVDTGAILSAGGFTALQVTINGNGNLTVVAPATMSSCASLIATGSGILNVGDVTAVDHVLTVGVLSISGGQTLIKQGVGTLLVNGTGSGTGTLNVGVGTLGGSGSIAGPVNIAAGAKLAPGNSPGVLTIAGPLMMGNTASYAVEIGGTTPGNTAANYDQTNVTASTGTPLVLNSPTLNVSEFAGFGSTDPNQVYYILTQGGTASVSGAFIDPLTNSVIPEGGTVTFADGVSTARVTYLADWTGDPATSTLTGGNDVALFQANIVPEPATLSLLGIGALGLLARRRRRHA